MTQLNTGQKIKHLREHYLSQGSSKMTQVKMVKELNRLGWTTGWNQGKLARIENNSFTDADLEVLAEFFSKKFTQAIQSALPGRESLSASKVVITARDLIELEIQDIDEKIYNPKADFEIESLPLLSIKFQNNSSHADSCHWDFGDGKFSSEVNPTHQYEKPGTYRIRLTIENWDKSKKSSAKKEITLKDDAIESQTVSQESNAELTDSLFVDFSTQDPMDLPSRTVQFLNKSSNAKTYHWDFGDQRNSLEKNPTHQFSEAGRYLVKLTASNKSEELSISRTIIVPEAAFTKKRLHRWTHPKEIRFFNKSKEAIFYSWEFGDGEESEEKNPWHSYSTFGSFKTKLTATSHHAKDTFIERSYVLPLHYIASGFFIIGAIFFWPYFVNWYCGQQNQLEIKIVTPQDGDTLAYNKIPVNGYLNGFKKDSDCFLFVERFDSNGIEKYWPKTGNKEHKIIFSNNFSICPKCEWNATIFDDDKSNLYSKEFRISIWCFPKSQSEIVDRWYSYCEKVGHFPPINEWEWIDVYKETIDPNFDPDLSTFILSRRDRVEDLTIIKD